MADNWLTQDDVQNYGHDVLDLAQRAAMHAVTPHLRRLDTQLAAEQRRGLERSLDAQIPDWRQIDNDPRWRQWLLFSDSYNNRPRQSLLNDAIAKGDAGRVLAFFRSYLAEAGQPAQGQQPQQAPSAMPTGRRVYSRQDITRASDDYRRGRYTEEQYRRLSEDIVAAGREGRIVGIGPPKGKAPYG